MFYQIGTCNFCNFNDAFSCRSCKLWVKELGRLQAKRESHLVDWYHIYQNFKRFKNDKNLPKEEQENLKAKTVIKDLVE